MNKSKRNGGIVSSIEAQRIAKEDMKKANTSINVFNFEKAIRLGPTNSSMIAIRL